MNTRKVVQPGKYLHYKGHKAEVVGVAKHSETLEELVVYKHPDPKTGEVELWVRPKEMFLEDVEVNGAIIPRFKYLEPELTKME